LPNGPSLFGERCPALGHPNPRVLDASYGALALPFLTAPPSAGSEAAPLPVRLRPATVLGLADRRIEPDPVTGGSPTTERSSPPARPAAPAAAVACPDPCSAPGSASPSAPLGS